MTGQVSRAELKAQLVSYAQQIGFDSCRTAACAAPTYGTEFREWLREGAHGEMNYMKRGEEKRCDPHKVLPGAQSIVVLALNYFQAEQVQTSEAAAKGKIARYAWGDDYHQSSKASSTRWTRFFVTSADSKNVTWIPGRSWNAITQHKLVSAGMAKTRC